MPINTSLGGRMARALPLSLTETDGRGAVKGLVGEEDWHSADCYDYVTEAGIDSFQLVRKDRQSPVYFCIDSLWSYYSLFKQPQKNIPTILKTVSIIIYPD